MPQNIYEYFILVAFKEYTGEKMPVKHFHSEIVVNYTNNYKETVTNTELNIKFLM